MTEATVLSGTAGARKILWLIWISLFVFVFGLMLVRIFLAPCRPPVQMKLADGRILQVEAVTYGTTHRIGHRAFIYDHFGPWVPQKMRDWFAPQSPENTIDLERPGLVVWVNAMDPATGTNMDCQGIRMEFVDRHGDLFGSEDSSWFGGRKFWREGHVFYCYPREEEQLKLRVTPWKKNENTPVIEQIGNPHVTKAANWSGTFLPQSKSVGPLGITLARLNMRTNEAKYWQTAAAYLEPVWQLRQAGQTAQGWSDPEWTAEDPTGNRGQYLSRHSLALRFFATIYPTVTNADATLLLATLPRVDLSILTYQLLWNSKILAGTNEIIALGVCPAGVHTFTSGNFDPAGPRMSAVGGGAPSGWTSQTKRITPMKLQTWRGHYTPTPTIYIRAAQLKEPNRLALRLRNDSGRMWTAKPEPQGNPDGVHAFLIVSPAEVTNVVPEVVLLKPAQAEFLVKTAATQ